MQLILPNFLIALREGVEAALVVGIIVAYINKVGRRDVLARFWIGVVLAAAIPLGLGIYWTWGPMTITFQAQEILGGVFSIVAALFVTWMIFWMGKNSRQLTANIHAEADQALESGNVHGLIWMGIVSVAREGAETAVMVWGVVKSSGTTQVWEPTIGVVLGLVAAIVIGYLIYRGSLHMNIHTFFTFTGYLLIFVAAGIFLYGFHDLQEASVLPGWGIFLWDHTAVITPLLQQWWFVILNAFFNLQYLFQPTALQLGAWIAYLVVVLPLFTLQIQGKIFVDKRTREEVDAAARAKVADKAE
ncbi:iron uptake transporter permease EfeU, partial [Paratractidigestivibacter sp.]